MALRLKKKTEQGEFRQDMEGYDSPGTSWDRLGTATDRPGIARDRAGITRDKWHNWNKNQGGQAMAWKKMWTYSELIRVIKSYLEPFEAI